MSNEMGSCAQGAREFDQVQYCSPKGSSPQWIIELWHTLLQDLTPRPSFRDYEPTTGRYVEADPIGLEGGMNLYLYGAASPLMQIDPFGLANGPWANANFKPYVPQQHISLGDMLSEPNGNMFPGFEQQDNKCSLGPIGPFADACVLDRCQRHDNCYADNKCNWSSWASNDLGGTKSCNRCNSGFFKDHGASGSW